MSKSKDFIIREVFLKTLLLIPSYLSTHLTLTLKSSFFSEIEKINEPKYFDVKLENATSEYKKVNLEYVDPTDKKLEFNKVRLPVKYEDGSIFFEMPEFTASDEEILKLKSSNGQIPDDQLERLVIEQKQKQPLAKAVKNLIVQDDSSQILGMKVSLLDDLQKHKINNLNLVLDMNKMKVDFFVGLNDYLKQKLKYHHPGKSILIRYQGLNAKELESTYESTILVFDKVSGEGTLYQISMAKLSGHLSKIFALSANSEFNKKIFPELGKDLLFKANSKATKLNGFKLGGESKGY